MPASLRPALVRVLAWVAPLWALVAAALVLAARRDDPGGWALLLVAGVTLLLLQRPALLTVGHVVPRWLLGGASLGVAVLGAALAAEALGAAPPSNGLEVCLGLSLLGLGVALTVSVGTRAPAARRLGPWACLFSLLAALVPLVDGLYGWVERRTGVAGDGPLRSVPAVGALALVALSAACLLLHPGEGLARLLTGTGQGERTARRLLPVALGVPVALGALRLWGEQAGHYDTRLGVVLLSLGTALLFAGAVLWGARSLQRADAFLDVVFESLPQMVFVKDAERLAFVRINRAGESLLGMPRQALLGKTDRDFFPEAEAAFFQEKDRRALETGELVLIEEESIQTAHGPRWLRTRKVPVRVEGIPAFLLGISEDITERKRMTDELRRAKERAETTSRELEAFSYSVSHDLRAPLRSIDGFSQALLEDFAPQLPPPATGYLERVRAAAQRMAGLIDDLLNLSRVSRAELSREPVSLTALAQDILAELGRREPREDVALEVEPGLEAHGDPRLLRIVLENLLGNAWKFSGRKGRTRISFRRAVAGPDVQAFVVRDEGAGFDMAYVDKLFGAFQRLHGATEFEGTGIGLATVQRILHRHGGDIRAEGAVGQGAAFTFTLPTHSPRPT